MELLTFEDVCGILRLQRTAMRHRLNMPDAPRPIHISQRSPRWIRTEVEAWIRSNQAPSAMTLSAPSRGGRPRRLAD